MDTDIPGVGAGHQAAGERWSNGKPSPSSPPGNRFRDNHHRSSRRWWTRNEPGDATSGTQSGVSPVSKPTAREPGRGSSGSRAEAADEDGPGQRGVRVIQREEWFHRAVIYQVDSSLFYDANGDGLAISRIRQKHTTFAAQNDGALAGFRSISLPLQDDGYDIQRSSAARSVRHYR